MKKSISKGLLKATLELDIPYLIYLWKVFVKNTECIPRIYDINSDDDVHELSEILSFEDIIDMEKFTKKGFQYFSIGNNGKIYGVKFDREDVRSLIILYWNEIFEDIKRDCISYHILKEYNAIDDEEEVYEVDYFKYVLFPVLFEED